MSRSPGAARRSVAPSNTLSPFLDGGLGAPPLRVLRTRLLTWKRCVSSDGANGGMSGG